MKKILSTTFFKGHVYNFCVTNATPDGESVTSIIFQTNRLFRIKDMPWDEPEALGYLNKQSNVLKASRVTVLTF